MRMTRKEKVFMGLDKMALMLILVNLLLLIGVLSIMAWRWVGSVWVETPGLVVFMGTTVFSLLWLWIRSTKDPLS